MKSAKTTAKALVDIGPLLPKVTKPDEALRRNLSGARRSVEQLRRAIDKLAVALKELESQDKLGNFEIQDLMSTYNQAEARASNVLKKRDDVANSIIGKV